MADQTKIEWADATINAINGCSLESPGCTNCYAMRAGGRNLPGYPSTGLTMPSKAGHVWTGEVRLHEPSLLKPLRWTKPRSIFWNAHGDTFHPKVPDEWIDRVFAVASLTPQHRHMILTKRPDRMRDYINSRPQAVWDRAALEMRPKALDQLKALPWPLPNVWLGTSVEDHERRGRIDALSDTQAAVRFVSFEPLLGRVDVCEQLGIWWNQTTGEWVREHKPKFDWAIVGGESGRGARPMHPDWARSLRDQCVGAGVAFHFKQIGDWGWIDAETHHADYVAACNGEAPWRGDRLLESNGTLLPGTSIQVGNRQYVRRVGKARAGRLLDGREWNEVPHG